MAPLHESVPPAFYGGTERVVSHLTEELVRQGHEVTLFASGDSVTSARLLPATPKALRLAQCEDPLAHHVCLVEDVCRRAHDFDVIHFHVDYIHYPLSARHTTPRLTTLHGRLDLSDLVPLYQTFPNEPVVSISHAQRTALPFANWAGTVHHGLPLDDLPFRPGPGSYLAFLGRISPEKRVDRAIEIATKVGMKLKIAAKVDGKDQEYFQQQVCPLLKGPWVEFVGEISQREKIDFLGDAVALLFPIDWPEPFGLVMIEAMACGTPVVAFKHGSVPEVVADGVSGYVVETMDEAIQATAKASQLDRFRCRRHFEDNFSVERMTMQYSLIYRRIVQEQDHTDPAGALSVI